jgi:hypothetical protein
MANLEEFTARTLRSLYFLTRAYRQISLIKRLADQGLNECLAADI